MRTRIVCEGALHRFHTNHHAALCPGTGVVISAGLYRSEVGKIGVPFDEEEEEDGGGGASSAGDSGRMARPFVGEDSGNTRMGRYGVLATTLERVVVVAAGSGESERLSGRSGKRMACGREICWTRRVEGKQRRIIGSKIAAR